MGETKIWEHHGIYGGWVGFNGSNSHLFGFSPHGREWWARWLVRPIWSIGNAISDARYWLSYRLIPKHQYQIVRTGLEPGYYDCDTLMLNACFALLKRYVVDEMGGVEEIEKFNTHLYAETDKNAPEGLQTRQADCQSEAVKLYLWWIVERPADLKRDEELVNLLYGRDGAIRMKMKEGNVGGLTQIEFENVKAEADKLREEHWALENKIHDDEQKMLHRLIDIRPSLWT